MCKSRLIQDIVANHKARILRNSDILYISTLPYSYLRRPDRAFPPLLRVIDSTCAAARRRVGHQEFRPHYPQLEG